MGNTNKAQTNNAKYGGVVYEYNIPDLDETKLKDEYKIVFIGESGTGTKTSLINRIKGVEFEEGIESSTGSLFFNIKVKLGENRETKLQLYDTAGKEKYREITKAFLRDIDGVVIGYDINNRKSYDEAISYWYPLIKNEFNARIIYLLGNKMDLYKEDGSITDEALNFAKSENIGFYTISCKTDECILEFLDDLVYNLVKQEN